jgi:hypothetical protein
VCVCCTNITHGVYGVPYNKCEIRLNFVKLSTAEKYSQTRKIQDGDRIEITYIPDLKGGADSPSPTKEEAKFVLRQLARDLNSPPPVPARSSHSPPPLPRGLLPYVDDSENSFDDEDGPNDNIPPTDDVNVLEQLSRTLKVQREKRKLKDTQAVPITSCPPRRLVSSMSDVEYSSNNTSEEISASSMSSESAQKEVKQQDARVDHRQALKNAIRSYDFYLDYFKHRQTVHLEQILHLTEIRNVCSAYLNSQRPIASQRKEIKKRLGRIPKVYESCIFARMKKTFDPFTFKREEDQDPDHG